MTPPDTPPKPLPLADDMTAAYWQAARNNRLAVQYCTPCSRYLHLPVESCPTCGTAELTFEAVSGRGTLYSYTVMHDAPAPGFADRLPYVVAVVELDEQSGLLVTTNLVDTDPVDVHIGMSLEATFEELAPGDVVPQFRPRKA
ncbi:Zn-ribbon domain-containing OB-fold protein [Rhodococcus rhodochrous]|uniref:Zn-ribbon domain-containing OB-fold protein n=1 Tax=Rhodococcus rhodochrous TaxID=1829 RepID=UPI000D07DA24|nr:Zn-ribbon domain-containing OB-fold protein [Rhodococcus rhodochrous]AYA24086.1 Zn-ribbon domain-containing OB-fold protein [Rhodococcus rhodochrous]